MDLKRYLFTLYSTMLLFTSPMYYARYMSCVYGLEICSLIYMTPLPSVRISRISPGISKAYRYPHLH